jgi:hypothetical protein
LRSRWKNPPARTAGPAAARITPSKPGVLRPARGMAESFRRATIRVRLEERCDRACCQTGGLPGSGRRRQSGPPAV